MTARGQIIERIILDATSPDTLILQLRAARSSISAGINPGDLRCSMFEDGTVIGVKANKGSIRTYPQERQS